MELQVHQTVGLVVNFYLQKNYSIYYELIERLQPVTGLGCWIHSYSFKQSSESISQSIFIKKILEDVYNVTVSHLKLNWSVRACAINSSIG